MAIHYIFNKTIIWYEIPLTCHYEQSEEFFLSVLNKLDRNLVFEIASPSDMPRFLANARNDMSKRGNIFNPHYS